jgi:hypothetical protein
MVMNLSSSFLGSSAQLRPWPPQNPAGFLGGFSTISYESLVSVNGRNFLTS